MVKSMTEPHKRLNRHPKYKTAYRVKNWHEYDQPCATAAISRYGLVKTPLTPGHRLRRESAVPSQFVLTSRLKRAFGDRLRAKREKSQEREASLACELLNRMRGLGQPQSYPVS